MLIRENISLQPFNTFHIDVKARYFATFANGDELTEIPVPASGHSPLIVGGGSNILFTRDYDGLVLKNEIPGIAEVHEDAAYVYVKAGAGETWHQFVLYCISRGWGGAENLSLIPGSVGASPIQNIGAYGVELEDIFWCLEAFHIPDKKVVTFTKSDCAFGYRDSVFKQKYKGQFIILNVTYRLSKKPVLNTRYGIIERELLNAGVTVPTIKDVSAAVIRIRSSKLPDPAVTGNAGSFFKNPVVSLDKYQWLESRFPGIIAYASGEGKMKLAAGWMIEQCGWKGQRKGDAGCHDQQALVLVNYGHATGDEIFRLSEEIIASVSKKFDVVLEREVNIV